MKKADAPKHERMEEGAMLITGCPRSGTKAVTAYFKEHGVELGHETAGEKGTVEWRHAYSEFDKEDPAFIIQMTLVRDPISTVRSLSELLCNCDRKSDTWAAIVTLSVLGGWNEKLEAFDWVGAAADWWTTVYERLYEFPVLKLEHLPKLKDVGRSARVNRELNIKGLLADCEDFWRVANAYGYYLPNAEDEEGHF